MPDPSAAPREAYRQRLDRAQAELRALDRRGAWLANFRGATFLAALTFAGLTVFSQLPGWGWAAAGGWLFAYGLLAFWHGKVIAEEERARVRVSLNERGLARLSGQWRSFEPAGERFADSSHLYTPDLDIFGKGSLFQLLDETATRAGEERLASWLMEPAPPEEILARQGAVRELAPLIDFRQALLAEARVAARRKADARRFIEWAAGGPTLAAIRWARPVGLLLPPLTLALYLLGRAAVAPPWLTGVALLVHLLLIVLTRKPLAALYERISMGEGGFVRFEDTFLTVERQAFGDARLGRLRGGLMAEGGELVSARLRRFGRLFGFAELRQSGQLHAVVNLLLLWDLFWLFRLEDWREREGPRVRGWFEALAELEALSAMGGFAHDRPDYPFPKLVPEGPRLVAAALGHPLLDRPVRNDVALTGPGQALLITGSNMSGKTTLLRAIGVNAVMAMAGLPVCAERLTVSPLRVLTSMRLKDSLERGVSYFYAEVQRMKAILDAAAEARGQAVFLLDELLMGTNTRERQIASRELLRLLLDTGACGAITTHDLSLTELEGRPGFGVRNVHFRDRLEGGKMTFDYRLREGVVTTTNALRVLREAGIELAGEPE